jgi:uncharacterized protein YecE (DUF72 family)
MLSDQQIAALKYFQFRKIHPQVFLGTASDRYTGWIGQVYSGRRYEGRIHRRSRTLGKKSFVEEVLPVDSVEEYFTHFRVLELDFTFYRPLLDEAGKSTQNFHTLRTYTHYLHKNDRLILKVPQVVFAKKLRQGGSYLPNDRYLDPALFTKQFYEPALGLVTPWLQGFVFEQEYQRKQDRSSPKAVASQLDTFFGSIPDDGRYHVELRTDSFLSPPVGEVLAKHGVGQVLSHWTWLPSLNRQFDLGGRRFLNKGNDCILRLMTPRGMRYEEAYSRCHPFTTLIDGMVDPRMVDDTVELMHSAVGQSKNIHVIINNRAGGNAPLLARQIAERFLTHHPDTAPTR